MLVMNTTGTAHSSAARVAYDVAQLTATVCLCLLSFVEHGRSIRPSSLLEIYLLVSLLFDMNRLRSPSIHASKAQIIISLLEVSFKIVLLALEARDKRSILRKPYQCLGPEATAGLLNRALLWWVNPVLIKGGFSLLSYEDLPPIDEALSSESLRQKIKSSWEHKSDYRSLFLHEQRH